MDGINLPYPPPPDAFQNMNGISSGYAMPVNIAQLQPDPNQGIIRDTFNAFMKKRQEQEQRGGLLQSILSGRFAMPDSTPNLQDVSRSITQTQQAFNAPDLFKAARPEEIAQQRVMSDLSPVTNQLGLMNTASSVVKNIRDSKNAGGATGELIDRMMAENPGMSFREALYQVQTGMRQGLQLDQNGNVIPMAGVPQALGVLAAGKEQGQKAVDLTYNPQIAGAEAQARTNVELGNARSIAAEKKIGEMEPNVRMGAANVTNTANTLEGLYNQLDQMGAAVNVNNGAFSNLGASVRSSPVGQAMGRRMGTAEQSIRNQINMQLPNLINDIRQATGMSAKSMDSNAELQFYLKMATDPNADIQSNKAALAAIKNKYLSNSQALSNYQTNGVQSMGGQQQPQAADPLGIR